MLTRCLGKVLCGGTVDGTAPILQGCWTKGVPIPWMEITGRCSHQYKGTEVGGGEGPRKKPHQGSPQRFGLYSFFSSQRSRSSPFESSLHWRVVRKWGEEALTIPNSSPQIVTGYGQWATFLFYFFHVHGLLQKCWKKDRERR